jgi:hypothetical protein
MEVSVEEKVVVGEVDEGNLLKKWCGEIKRAKSTVLLWKELKRGEKALAPLAPSMQHSKLLLTPHDFG